MINFSDINKTFEDGKEALKNISLEINNCEFVALLGPSGSGKTTLLRLVNGLYASSKGEINIDGIKVSENNLLEIRQNVGMIFQHFNLVGNLSVINNVLSGCLARHKKWCSGVYVFPKQLRIDALEVIDKVGLLDKAYQRSDRLSGGEQQRVGIARALMQKPKILLADEPVSSLDPLAAYNILKLLKKISEEYNITVLCSLHQVEFALKFFNRIIGLSEGSIVIDQNSNSITMDYIKKMYSLKESGMFFGAEIEPIETNKSVSWMDYK